LVTGLAHELNTPIGTASLVGSALTEQASIIERNLEANQIKRSDLAAFVKAVTEGASLISKTLNHANELVSTFKQVGVDQASMQRREFELSQTVADALGALAVSFKGSGVQLSSTVPIGIRIDSYPGMVTQILLNLIENARKHAFDAKSGGSVFVEARDFGEEVEIAVSDNGSGIPQDLREKIFEPFFTTKKGEGGSGLGLSIVQRLVTQGLGGSIELDSTSKEGSQFFIRFPKSAPS